MIESHEQLSGCRKCLEKRILVHLHRIETHSGAFIFAACSSIVALAACLET